MVSQLSRFTKTLLTISIIFIVYGYLCRIIGLYFFWEGKAIGWSRLFIGIIGFLVDRIKIKENKKTIPDKIGIGFIAFILLIQTILMGIIPFSDAYAVAKTYLINNAELKTEIGNIKGFGIIPEGGIHKKTDSSGEYGSATINLTVKGENKFKDVTVYLFKSPENLEWQVNGIE